MHPFFLISTVALIGMLAPFSIDTYLPSFPAIEKALEINRELLTQTLSIYLLSFALATLIWGPLSDRFGRRKVIIVSLIGYLFASAICALADNLHSLLLGRALQGMMAAGSLVASRAMIRDYFDSTEAQKAMALMMMLFSAAPAVAPIIGGYLDVHFGWRSVFVFLALYGLLLTILMITKIDETQNLQHIQSIHPKQVGKNYWHSLQHPRFLKIVLSQGALMGGFFLYVAGSTSLIYDHLQLGEQDFWQFFVPMVSGILVGSWMIHKTSHQLPAGQLVKIAFITILVAVSANLFLQHLALINVLSVIAPIVLYAIGFSMANPGLSIAGLDCLPEKRGMASALQSLFQMGTAGLVTAFILPFVHHSLMAMALAQALLVALSISLWWLATRANPTDPIETTEKFNP